MRHYYTIYNNKDDQIVAFGDAKACAHQLNVTLDSFYSFVSNTRSGRTRSYAVVVEECKEEDIYDPPLGLNA